MGNQAVRLINILAVLILLAGCSGGEGGDSVAGTADDSTGTPGANTPVPETEEGSGQGTEPVADSSGDGEPTSLQLTLNFLAGGPQAGFTYAKELGYFEEEGLIVEIQEGEGSATTAQLVATGATDVGFADAPAAMQVRAQGGPVKIVAAILQTNGFAIISLAETGIESVADLAGMTIAVQPGSAQTALLDAVFQANDIAEDEVEVVNIDPSALVGTLLQGDVDAILGGADFQSIQLRAQGAEINELFYRDIGVPTVGLSVAAPESLIENNSGAVAGFVRASLRGWDAARDDPEAAAQSLVDTFGSAELEDILMQLKVDLQLLCAEGAETLGEPPTEIWQRTHDLLVEYQDLPEDPSVDDYYTMEFVPEDAPEC